MDKYNLYRSMYPEFIYDKFNYYEEDDKFVITYKFIITNLCEFNPTLKINKQTFKNKNINKKFFDYLVFHIGLVEMISYYKAVCPKKIIIKAGFLNNDQVNWFKKLMFKGLSEFYYKNNINVTIDDMCEIIADSNESFNQENIFFNGDGNIIPVGGGKDSCVTLELLKEENNLALLINPKKPQLECAYKSGLNDENIISIERKIDPKLLDLNEQGFLNGHTPFTALTSFISYLCAYISNRKKYYSFKWIKCKW